MKDVIQDYVPNHDFKFTSAQITDVLIGCRCYHFIPFPLKYQRAEADFSKLLPLFPWHKLPSEKQTLQSKENYWCRTKKKKKKLKKHI